MALLAAAAVSVALTEEQSSVDAFETIRECKTTDNQLTVAGRYDDRVNNSTCPHAKRMQKKIQVFQPDRSINGY